MTKPLKDDKRRPEPIFPFRTPSGPLNEEVSVSRYEPALRCMLEEQIQGTLDPTIFPPIKPDLEANGSGVDVVAQQSSLRTANKPTWARTRPVGNEHRQRILVFVAGGATYAEARSCYQVSQKASKEVFLITSHMLTPKLFLDQLGGLDVDKRYLDIPADRPPPEAPRHLFQRPLPSQAQGLPQQHISRLSGQEAPMRNMNLNTTGGGGPRANGAFDASLPGSAPPGQAGKLKKDKSEEKKKKKLPFFSRRD